MVKSTEHSPYLYAYMILYVYIYYICIYIIYIYICATCISLVQVVFASKIPAVFDSHRVYDADGTTVARRACSLAAMQGELDWASITMESMVNLW